MGVTIVFIICLTLVGLLIYMYKEAHIDRVIYQELAFSNFPSTLGRVNIFFISDIHRRLISDQIIEEVKGKVDLVIIGGDLLESGVPLERVEKNIQKLRELGLVYFVWGNNDYEVDPHILDALLLKYGVKILDNTAVSFESDEGERLLLLGVDDLGKKRDRLDLALQDAGDGGFKILISHNPKIMAKIQEEDEISIVLSGHTHGGQIRLFGFGLYEKGTLTRKGNITHLVSNGYGTTTLPLRLGAKPETHLISLKNDSVA